MKCFNKLFTILMVSLFVVPTIQAQDEKVILYNRTPVKVELADDKIVSFIGEAPEGYMAGYDLSETNAIVADQNVVKKPLMDISSKNADYAIQSKDRFFLEYKPGFAILDKAIITELNMISFKLKLDNQAKVLLTAHVADDEGVNDKLSRNRLDAIISYLKVKGIGPERTKIEYLKGPAMLDKVAVSFLL